MNATAHHSHAAHPHAVSTDADLRWLAVALAVNVAFMAVELTAGILASSLALLSDAAHMLTDAGAIGLALFVARLARRRPEGAMTYGFGRAEILSAQINGLTLVILSAFIVYEAVRRLVAPPHVEASLVLAVGLAGVLVNAAAALALARAERRSLNVEGALKHNLIDAYASAATAVGAGVILIWGFERADPIASLLIAAPMILSGVGLVKASGRVFLEAAPEGIDPEQIGFAMAEQPGVIEVHDLHVWEVTSGFPALSAHLLVVPDQDCHELRRKVEKMLGERFRIEHTTLQVEPQASELLEIEPVRVARGPGAD
ncbi:MAG TPA: cation diffusion facilitator family transporter [Solirubrobacteraceae bacterium]|jgi:cobalt-zinc-cadmium efflux system protein|nr:cation diffusion facilitator family transporter [Solirubrobacteraceae bacterium]